MSFHIRFFLQICCYSLCDVASSRFIVLFCFPFCDIRFCLILVWHEIKSGLNFTLWNKGLSVCPVSYSKFLIINHYQSLIILSVLLNLVLWTPLRFSLAKVSCLCKESSFSFLGSCSQKQNQTWDWSSTALLNGQRMEKWKFSSQINSP